MLHRRTVLRTSAWSVPALTLVAAAPATAASQPAPTGLSLQVFTAGGSDDTNVAYYSFTWTGGPPSHVVTVSHTSSQGSSALVSGGAGDVSVAAGGSVSATVFKDDFDQLTVTSPALGVPLTSWSTVFAFPGSEVRSFDGPFL